MSSATFLFFTLPAQAADKKPAFLCVCPSAPGPRPDQAPGFAANTEKSVDIKDGVRGSVALPPPPSAALPMATGEDPETPVKTPGPP